VTEDELRKLLESGQPLIAYDGFEPSGQIHIAQGLLRAINVNKMIRAGCKFKMLVADWHAWANHKMGGDLEKIQTVGEYFIEVWKACGMDLDHVEFVWASDLVKQPGYWDTVMQIAVKNNLPRIIRTVEIMGRDETETLTASQIIYPLMQATDIFTLNANITQLGMDQRKVNMLAREVAEDLGFPKPIVVSHHMLQGLSPLESPGIIREADDTTPQAPGLLTKAESATDRAIRLKMSKSKPDSSIFMTDSPTDIERKIAKAWCPEGIVEENPILEYCKYIVFEKVDDLPAQAGMTIERPDKYGGTITYKNYDQLEKDYVAKKLFPLDLKNALAKYLDKFLQPVREHFAKNTEAKKLKELVESYAVTR